MISDVSRGSFSRPGGVARRLVLCAGALGLMVFALASCTTTDKRLVEALKGTSVSEVRVETAPDVRRSNLFKSGKPDPQLSAVVSALKSKMGQELVGLPGGPVRGRLVVTLNLVDVSSDGERILVGGDSSIEGTVRLENAATGALIAVEPRVRAQDNGVKGGGLGVIVAVAVNAATISGQKDALASRLATSFTKEVKAWLTQK